MMKTKALFSRLPAVALVAAVSAYPMLGQAATITAGTAVEVGVASDDFTSLLTDLASSEAANTSSTDYSVGPGYTWDSAGPDYASANARANQDGWMYSTAGGDNTFKSVSHVQQSLTITNDTGVDQNYSFDFTILAGSMDIWGGFDQFADDEVVAAGNLVSISLDGVELFGSSALLVGNNSGVSLMTEGSVLGSYSAGDNYYEWNQLTDSLDLGVFAAGESFTLTYDIYTAAAGIYDAASSGIGEEGGCYYEGESEIEGEVCDYAYAYSQFGDPNGVHGSPIAGNVQGTPVMSVPEPSLWLLMGTGLFGFAVARRRKATRV